MDLKLPLPLLGGLSPALFMRRHWQKKPLLVRQAWPGVQPPLARAGLFDLAASEDVEARLVLRDGLPVAVAVGNGEIRMLSELGEREAFDARAALGVPNGAAVATDTLQ